MKTWESVNPPVDDTHVYPNTDHAFPGKIIFINVSAELAFICHLGILFLSE